jgi:F0F1-type ATP synthase membrane subunit b/b'
MSDALNQQEGEDIPIMDEEGKPWWLGEAKRLVWTLGPVTLSFFLLLLVLLGWLPSPTLQALEACAKAMTSQQVQIESLKEVISTILRETRENQIGSLKTSRQICRNTARTPQQNERCDEL